MFKRIISIFLALCLAVSCFCFPASASTYDTDVGTSCGKYFSLLSDYISGEISYEAFKDKTKALLHDIPDDSNKSTFETLISGLTSAAEGVSYASANVSGAFVKTFRDTLQGLEDFFDFGFDTGKNLRFIFDDLWNEFCTDKGYTSSDIDMNGFGAFIRFDTNISERSNSSTAYLYTAYIYCDYIVYDPTQDGRAKIYIYGDNNIEIKCSGKEVSFTGSGVSATVGEFSLFGDVRYTDGSSADDITTEPNIEPTPPEDIGDVDLSDFLKDLLEKLKDLFPDTSTIEGLLRQILAKCTSIDEKMNESGGGMRADELQDILDKAILSLATQNKVNNNQLLQELIAMRKLLQGYGDEEIPPEEADSILQGLISGITSGLLSFVGIDLDVSEIIEICEEAGDLGISVLRGIVDIITILNAAVPLQAVNALITTLTGIIFNLNAPTDLTFTLDGQSYTLLSANILSVAPVAAALNIIKGLVSIIVAYAWLKWARKFYLSQF